MDRASDCVGKKLAPFNPSGQHVIRAAIDIMEICESDVFYDLGCGDGRILVEVVKATGARAVGAEYDKRFADRAQQRVKDAELGSKIEIVHGDLLDMDLTEATALFLYLVPEGLAAVRLSILDLLRRGGRVASYVFSVPDLAPVRVEKFKATKLYLYTRDSLGPPGPCPNTGLPQAEGSNEKQSSP